MYHPVKPPIPTVKTILQILIAFDPGLIFSSPERRRSRLPMNAGTSSFGDMIIVANPYIIGCTVGNVDTAPLQIEYGKGQRRIMHSNFNPSYFSVKARAANLLSCSMRRLTNLDKTVRETTKETVEPSIVPDA